jgi:hypothetical protein
MTASTGNVASRDAFRDNSMEASSPAHAAPRPTRGRRWSRYAARVVRRYSAFLLTALRRFLINSEAEPRALKRGGAVPIDQLLENTQAGNSTTMVDDSTPEREFGRRRVIAILDVAVSRLRGEVEAAGKRAMFDQLHEFLSERPDDADYVRAAAALSMRRNTVAVAVPAPSSARSGARRAEADDYRARGFGRRAAGIAVRTAGFARAGPTV